MHIFTLPRSGTHCTPFRFDPVLLYSIVLISFVDKYSVVRNMHFILIQNLPQNYAIKRKSSGLVIYSVLEKFNNNSCNCNSHRHSSVAARTVSKIIDAAAFIGASIKLCPLKNLKDSNQGNYARASSNCYCVVLCVDFLIHRSRLATH